MRTIDKIVFCVISLIIILHAVFRMEKNDMILQICLAVIIIILVLTREPKEKAK